MTYLIQYIRGDTVIATEEFFEKPSEDHLRETCARVGADFADVSRTEELIYDA